jgi:predicted permease
MNVPLWRRKQKDELDEELRAHHSAAVQERIERGASPAEAEAAARREFGNAGLVAETTREMWGWASLDRLAQDVRYGLRQLRRNPGFTLTAVLTLALGIGANTAIFSAVSAVLLRPLPIASPGEVVSVRNNSGRAMFNAFSFPNYRDIRDRSTAFSDVMAFRFTPVAVSHEDTNQRIWCYMVTGNYFPGLGLRPHLGRLLTPDDDRNLGAHPVAVIGYDAWQRRFASRADVVGQEIIVNGRSYTVVGVGPKGFAGTEVIASPEIWFPVAMQPALEPGSNALEARGLPVFTVLARMKRGASRAQAEAEVAAISRSLATEFPDENKDMNIALSPPGMLSGGGFLRSASLGFATLLLSGAGLVLVLACANLSNMLLARATERREETAVRLAMGASRIRLVRQLLTESMLLAMAGGLVAILPALWPLRFSVQMKPPADFPMVLDVQWDLRVLAFAFLITVITGVAFGLLPALQASRAEVAVSLKGGQPTAMRRRWVRGSLVAVQVALSLVLLTGAGLLVRALGQAQHLELGFEPRGAVEVGFDLRIQGYDAPSGRELQKQMLERVRAMPGVQAAGFADVVPLDLHFFATPVFIEGVPEERNSSTPRALSSRVSPGYFAAMGTRLLAGRDFTDSDDLTGEPVAVVNLAFARRFWGTEEAIGKRFSLGNPRAPKLKVVGVVQNGRYNSLNAESQPFAFRSAWQSYSGATGMVVRSSMDEPAVMAAVRREVQPLDSQMPLSVSPLRDRLGVALLPARVAATVLGAFAALGLALAAVGIYGVISYAVSRRTRELGIRMAMGARKADVLRLVIRQGMRPALIGALLGLPATYALTLLMQSFLFGLSPTDPLTYSATAAVLATVALLACFVPALRATRVDPVVALRHE